MTSELVGIGSMFAGIGILSLMLVLTYMIYQFVRTFKSAADLDEKYSLMEEMAINKMAMKKGVDLDKEVMKRSLLKLRRKSFRLKLQEEIYQEMFGKETKKEK